MPPYFENNSGEIIADIYLGIPGASLLSLDYDNNSDVDFIIGINDELYLYLNNNESYNLIYLGRLPKNQEGYDDDIRLGGLTSADYNNDGYDDIITGGVQGVVRLFINTKGRITVDAHGPYNGIVDEPVHFKGTASGGYPPYDWRWDFGDGNTSNEQNPVHVFTNHNVYKVELIVTDSKGNTSSNTTTATIVENTPPTIDITKPKNALYVFNKRLLSLLKPFIIGRIDIEVNASDEQGKIQRVEFYIDSELKFVDTIEPYLFTWDERTFFTHTIKAIAYDTSGKNSSDEIIVRKFF